MSIKTKVGHVIWHDLLTHDVAETRCFYSNLLGWTYQIEYASDFVWTSGEAEYPLILANGEAHGGFVDAGQDTPSCWIAYVMVKDVDAITARAKDLGATIEREPFDTPGVGRSSVIRDPQGAIICATAPTYNFPAPKGTFLWDELISNDVEAAKLFYCELFSWKPHDIDQTGSNTILKCLDDTDVVGAIKQSCVALVRAAWVTYLATDDVGAAIAKAKGLGASLCMEGNGLSNVGRKAVLTDPAGVMFGLLTATELHQMSQIQTSSQ